MKLQIKIKNINDLIFLIADKGYNIVEFAKEIKVSPSYFYKLAKGKHHPTPKMATKIAKGLDVSLDRIFYINNDKF